MSSITKRIPIAIGIKPDAVTTFTNKTIDGSQNTFQNIPTSALSFSTITINGNSIPLGGSIDIQAQGGPAVLNTDTTYSIKTSSQVGGVSLDLDAGGSGTGTSAVNILGAGSITVSRNSSDTFTISDAGQGVSGTFITTTSTDTLSNKTISGNANTLTDIPNSALANSSITINGQVIALGGTATIAGGGGGGSGDVTTNGTQTLTNKTISGINNTLLSIDKTSLKSEHRYISINGTQVELGTNFDVSGLGDVTTTGTQDLSNKSLLSPIISNGVHIGEIKLGSGGGSPGTAGQVIKSQGAGQNAVWANEDRTTAASLSIGSGLSGTGGTEFDGSNGITIAINTGVVATLTGSQTLQNKTLQNCSLSDGINSVGLPSIGPSDTLVTKDAAQTLTNKTLDAVNLTGDLQVDGVSGANGQVIVSDGAGGLTWGAGGGGGGGTGDVTGPTGATDNALARYDTVSGKVIQDSLVTVSDTGAIIAPATGSVIPFLFSDQASFPSASTYHGAIAHSHADGAMFFAHSGSWVQLAKSSEVQVGSRTTHQATTGNLSNNSTAYPDITGGYKSYMLFKIQTSNAAWVRVYTSKAARSADTTRSIDVDPVPGSGVIAEVITTGNQTQVLTPATIGFNDESTPVGEFYLSVTNRSGSSTAITVTLTALKLEA